MLKSFVIRSLKKPTNAKITGRGIMAGLLYFPGFLSDSLAAGPFKCSYRG